METEQTTVRVRLYEYEYTVERNRAIGVHKARNRATERAVSIIVKQNISLTSIRF